MCGVGDGKTGEVASGWRMAGLRVVGDYHVLLLADSSIGVLGWL